MVSPYPSTKQQQCCCPIPAWLGVGEPLPAPPEQLGMGDQLGPAHPSQGLQLEQGWDCLYCPTVTPVCSSHRPLKSPGEQFTPQG